MMQEQLSRTELLIGSEGLEKLKNVKVAVFGIGRVGGYVEKHWQEAVWVLLISLTVTPLHCQI